MGRKKKSVLNQIIKEPKIEAVIKEEVVEAPKITPKVEEIFQDTLKEEISLNVSSVGEPKEPEEISLREQEEISLKVSGEKLAEVLEEKKLETVRP